MSTDAAGIEQTAEHSKEFEPKIVAFLCNWCSYAGADLAGVNRAQYPPNIRVIRVMCSSRVSPLFVMKAFRSGADGVLISGCHPGDCHYISGNYLARRKFIMFRDLLGYMGIDPRRFAVSWVSASEGSRFAEVVKSVVDDVKKLGPQKSMVKQED
jgi:coenzyme F420-reducing hydrogenase delta subunit